MPRHRRPLAAALGLYLVLAAVFSFVCDDAYISFRYARNWVRGHGLGYNLGEQPLVEGYTNFGWVAVAAVCEALGVPPWLVLPVLSACCGALLLVWVHRVVARLELGPRAADTAAFALALSPPMVVWATSGLATMSYALLVFIAFERLVLARGRTSLVHAVLAGVAVALLRFEGIGWVVVLAVLGALTRRPGRSAVFLVGVVAGWAPYYAWRTAIYGDWLPNTARVKIDPGWEAMVRGARYLAMNAFAMILPLPYLLGVPAAVRRHGRLGLAVLAMAVGFPAYSVVVGGDFMAMGRLLVPSYPFAAMLLAWWVSSLVERGRAPRTVTRIAAALLVVGALPMAGVAPLPAPARAWISVRHGTTRRWTEQHYWWVMRNNASRWYRKGLVLRQLSEPGDSLVSGGIGAVGYASGLTIYDQNGLVTPEVARHPPSIRAQARMPGHDRYVSPSFFLDREPTYLRAMLLAPDPKQTAPAGQLAPPKPGAIRKELSRTGTSARIRREYLPELTRQGDRWLFVVRRAQPGDDTEPTWKAFREFDEE